MKTPATEYTEALSGGRHAGFLKKLADMGQNQIDRAEKSLEKQITDHAQKVASPAAVVQDWAVRSPQYRDGLLAKWRSEIDNFSAQVNIIKGFKNAKQ